MFELYLLSFNCARNPVDPDSLAPPLFNALPATASLPDVVAISLQEVSPIAYSFLGGAYLYPYFDKVTEAIQLAASLRSHGEERLDHVATRSLGMTALMIYAKPQVAQRIQWIQSAGAGVGFWNMGNKGAVAMRLGLSCPGSDDILKMTFTAAHLAPMECKVEARNNDWKTITENLVFLNNDKSGYSSSEETPLLESAEELPDDNNGLFSPANHIFFAGDLNYRTHDRPPGPDSHKSFPQPALSPTSDSHFSHFLKNDQLSREREGHRTLHGLDELPINFPPTYKLSTHNNGAASSHKRSNSADADQEQWKWAKHRYPSWCDRILYYKTKELEPQVYTALPIQHTSDHRPVALYARVHDRPLPDDTQPTAPFSINPYWKSRRDNARRLEVIVGSLAYIALTPKGNAIAVTIASIIFAGWWVISSLLR